MRLGCVLFALALSFSLVAQSYQSRIHYKVKLGDTRQLHQLILLDYTKLLGVALEIEGDKIYFQLRSAAETSVIPLDQLRFLGVFTGATANSILRGPQPTIRLADLTYERTALPFQTKSQLRVINLIYVVSEWNLNKHLQLGLGVAGPLGVLATAKLRYTVLPDVHVGLSNQILFPPFSQGFNDGPLVLGDAHAMVTVGSDKRFFNFGTGLLYNTDDFEGSAWAHRVALGGQVSRKWHLYAESLMVLGRSSDGTPRDITLLPSINAALGVRSHRWQFGLITVYSGFDDIGPLPVPYVGYSYYWGNL
ncbi:MAG: hypothetical protein ACI81P_002096 [Neolewinella sp.]|jgi:hypothetical protein